MNPLPRRRAALLLLLSLLCGGCAFFHRHTQSRSPFKKLSPPVAYEMMRDSPEMLVLDLRPAQQFNSPTGHIRAAKNIPLSRLPYRLLEILPFREGTVLIYCETNECADTGTKILAASGFENVILMDGGIEKWIRDGFKTVLPARIAERRGETEEKPVMPERPGEKKNDPNREVPVKPPQPPPPPPEQNPSPPPPGVAAPRQIG
jgi:rhodanese-related sulfurtransferase